MAQNYRLFLLSEWPGVCDPFECLNLTWWQWGHKFDVFKLIYQIYLIVPGFRHRLSLLPRSDSWVF
jgi:hypothetical protein